MFSLATGDVLQPLTFDEFRVNPYGNDVTMWEYCNNLEKQTSEETVLPLLFSVIAAAVSGLQNTLVSLADPTVNQPDHMVV